jgi:hypothetical protein
VAVYGLGKRNECPEAHREDGRKALVFKINASVNSRCAIPTCLMAFAG